jgi:hypothetical protein
MPQVAAMSSLLHYYRIASGQFFLGWKPPVKWGIYNETWGLELRDTQFLCHFYVNFLGENPENSRFGVSVHSSTHSHPSLGSFLSQPPPSQFLGRIADLQKVFLFRVARVSRWKPLSRNARFMCKKQCHHIVGYQCYRPHKMIVGNNTKKALDAMSKLDPSQCLLDCWLIHETTLLDKMKK